VIVKYPSPLLIVECAVLVWVLRIVTSAPTITALAGSVIGGLMTFAAVWVTQRQHANVQWLLQEKTRRQELYQQFIEEASRSYVDALIHDETALAPLVSLYALINKMRVVSDPRIAERADKFVRMILDTYVFPNKTLPELRSMMESDALDPLRECAEKNCPH